EIRIAFDRVIETLKRVFDLAHPVPGLADQVVYPRLLWAERQRAAGEIDALLELAFVAGDHRDVIERIGIARGIAQDLSIAVHRQRNPPRPVVEPALP